MSNVIRTNPTDDPEFIALIERVVCRLFNLRGYQEAFFVEVKNWFDHKWLKFSGIGIVPFSDPSISHPQVALDAFWQNKLTLPPFSPNRILRQQRHTNPTNKTRLPLHRTHDRNHSSANLQNRVVNASNSAIFAWFSSGTKHNDRGSMMVYQVQNGAASGWYASFQKCPNWKLGLVKNISRGIVEELLNPDSHPPVALETFTANPPN